VASERSSLQILRRLLAFSRPYVLAIVAVALFTLLFSAGRYARAYLMKPLIDGVLVPVVEESVEEPVEESVAKSVEEPRDGDWLDRALNRVLPDGSFAPPSPALDAAQASAPPPSDAVPVVTNVAPVAPVTERDLASVRSTFRELLLAAAVIVFVTPLALFGRSYLSEFVLGRIGVDIKEKIARRLLQLPLARHHAERSGDLISRTLSDANSAREALELVFQDFLVAITMVVIGAATLFYISPPLTLVSLGAAPLIVGVLVLFGRRIRLTARHRQEQLGEVTHRLLEILGGIKIIKAFGGEELEADAFARETRKLFRSDLRVVKNRVFSRAVVEALNSGAGIGLLMLGSLLVVQGRWGLTTGDVAAFATVLATTYRPIKNLAKGHAKLMECLASSERFFAVLDLPGEAADPPDALPLQDAPRSIRFEGVTLRRPDGVGGEHTVLDAIDLDVRAGEVVAVVGRTGGGKTSLLDLLLRFGDPSGGRILIDDVDIRRIARRSLRDRIAVVTQDSFLFDTSIRENIRYGRADCSEDEFTEAARAAHVDEFVDHLPMGYDTPVGEFGVRLSGGQRQRITIARALLRDPAILIFDEATSALDAKTERIVHEAIDRLRGERTVFLIAHRLSTIRRADRIVVLERGRIVQAGRHRELMAEEGLYRELAGPQEGADGSSEGPHDSDEPQVG